MKKLLKLFTFLSMFAFTSCGDNDETPATTPPPIVGEWVNVGRYVEGTYIEGPDCAQIETYIFEAESGIAYEEYCGNEFPDTPFNFQTTPIGDNSYQFIFENGGPWLVEQGTINTATIVDGKLHIETFQASEIDDPNRSYYIAVYEKVIELPQ